MNPLFLAFACMCAALVFSVVSQPRRIYEYPYFMAFVFAGFVLPQAYGIAVGGWAPEEWIRDLLLMCVLCLSSVWLGYRVEPKKTMLSKLKIPVNESLFGLAGLGLVGMGYFFDYLISRLPAEAKGTQWTGIVTIYGFFGNQVITGLAICLLCALKYRRKFFWFPAIVASFIPLSAAILFGRREETALLILTIVLILYFVKGVVPPRWSVAAALVLATVTIPATEQFRRARGDGIDPWNALKEVDYQNPLRGYSDVSATSEVKNAMYMIAATKAASAYQFGEAYWNRIVFSFVPGQWLGKDFKLGLMIGDPERDDPSRLVSDYLAYTFPTGSTMTGMGDSFNQFGFLGALFFAVLGCGFRYLWAAVQGDNPILQIFYIQSMVGAMRGVTHESIDVLPAMIYSAIFLLLVGVLTRTRAEQSLKVPKAIRGLA